MSLDEPSLPEGVAERADLLLVLPVCLAQRSGQLLFESQACNGMERWLENFSRIIAICPVLTGSAIQGAGKSVWKPVTEIAGGDRVQFVPLPYATTAGSFARAYRAGRAAIRDAIGRSRYLCFAIGGLFGDWGAVACLEAQRQRRPYAVWTDRVEHKVGLMSCEGQGPIRRWKERVRSRLMYRLEQRCIRRASLGLFHGASCFAEYAPWCQSSHLVHDIHAKASDAIGSEQLDAKCQRIATGELLRIVYVGRADEMKGPLDWLDVVEMLHERGVDFQARWIGDGPLLGTMRKVVDERALQGVVSLPGFLTDRGEVFDSLRNSHVFLFCHKTPESPRNLVEALISGCPIVGYYDDYAADLAKSGGGVIGKLGDREFLVRQLAQLEADRAEMATLTRAAAEAGKSFNDVAVFRHRSELIKSNL